VLLVVGAGLLAATLVVLHTPGVNGPLYWTWPWRRLPALSVYPWMALAALPFAAAQWRYARDPGRTRQALALASLAAMAMMLVAATRDGGLERVVQVVQHPTTTSYFTDAVRILESGAVGGPRWLRWYPQLMPQFHMHTLTKPPAPLLYYLGFAAALGPARQAALAAALVAAPLAALSVPATYLLLRRVTGRRDAAFHGASFLALCPSYLLFFPGLDPVHPVLACALWGTWAAAVDRSRREMAVVFGIVLAAVCFTSYSLLVMGTLLLGYAVLRIAEGKTTVAGVLRLAATGLGTFLAANVLLYLLFGYDPAAVFAQALRNQAVLLQDIERPYPATILFDLTDFAMGAGWTGAILALLCFVRRGGSGGDGRFARRAAALCIAQLALVAVTALLPGETARVWIFLLPALMVPVGLELARWTPRARLLAYGATWLVTAAILQNMRFLA
jgi:hypothetical protein